MEYIVDIGVEDDTIDVVEGSGEDRRSDSDDDDDA